MDYKVTRSELIDNKWVIVWTCKCYDTWKSMIYRCYDNRNKAYSNVKVCDGWKTFSNFKEWYDENHIDNFQLDKDLKTLGVDKIYSPENCCFVPSKVNNFLTGCGDFLDDSKGVWFDDSQSIKKYKAQANKLSKGMVNLGRYETKKEAHIAYLKYKLEQVSILIAEFEEENIRHLLVGVGEYLIKLMKSKENIYNG